MSSLQELRKSKGMTQRVLSNKSGVSIVRIQKIEQNIAQLTNIRKDTLIKLANALDMTKEQLFNECQQWEIENKDVISDYQNKIKRKRHNITKKEWEACKKYFNNECAYCGLKEKDNCIPHNYHKVHRDFDKEHVDSFGTGDLSNCVPSCKRCNISKHTKSLNEWYTKENNYGYTKERYDKIMKWLNGDYKNFIESQRY